MKVFFMVLVLVRAKELFSNEKNLRSRRFKKNTYPFNLIAVRKTIWDIKEISSVFFLC